MRTDSADSRPASNVSPLVPAQPPTALNAGGGQTRGGELSRLGRMFSTLEVLASTDPDAFWAVTTEIADDLDEASTFATGRHADWLADMAGRFAIAAKEGSTDAILMAARDKGAFRFCAREFQAIRAIATTASSLTGDGDEHVRHAWEGIYELVDRAASAS